MYDLILKNGTLVNEGSIYESDIAIKGDRIEKISSSIDAEAKKIIDLDGKYILPGLIDDQVHFREPGLTHKGNIQSESRAGLAGGVTSYFEMPNVNPTTTNRKNLQAKFDLAATKSHANYSFYMGASNTNIDEIKQLDNTLACGLKVFMGASTGDMLVDNQDTLEAIFREAPVNIVTHCEDTPTIIENEKAIIAEYGEDIDAKFHPRIRDAASCLKSSQLAYDLATKHGSNLHILHLTTADEMKLFTEGEITGKKITAEVCVHHLFFSEADYETRGNFIKCNPSVKSEQDRLALIDAVQKNKIDIIATDHAPHTLEEKQQPYLQAPSGLPLNQHSLLVLLDFYNKGIFTLEQIVQKTSHNIAERFQIKDRGYIREGSFADLAIVDLSANTLVTNENILYHCGWSPFIDCTFPAAVVHTIINGEIVFEDGVLKEQLPIGSRIEFNR
ncbi:MAG: dihydroorotase [SAR86 cluster bacterium]|jgi:dihydroorotase|nr:dihydroorotase [SAR86 cluster bacterium]MBL6822214.1 dihydroorotase [SAR86 cluster bacterium]MDA9141135.1 dihydroorotase [Gammaproteobacteria bacterium]